MRAADQRGPNEIGFGRLYLGDRRTEIGDIKREEVDRRNLAAILAYIFLHPLGGDLAIIVVGGDHVDFLAPLLHGVGHELLDSLRRRDAGVELVAIANAALILRVVEIERLEFVEYGPDDFARG